VERVRRHQPLAQEDIDACVGLELRLLRNTVFATRGQAFKSPELSVFFSTFPWYAPSAATIPNAVLDAADLANLELFRAAEAGRDTAEAGRTHWDLLLLILKLDDHATPALSAEEKSLVGTWTHSTPVPDQEIVVVRTHFDFFSNRRITKRWQDCRGGTLVKVGSWALEKGEITVRWFGELRAIGGKSVSRGPDLCPEWREMPLAKLFPVDEHASLTVSQTKYYSVLDHGRLVTLGPDKQRNFDGYDMLRDDDVPVPESFDVDAMRP
jgi:hypothetical protein